MVCIYNTGGFCYRDNEKTEECQYIGDEENCVEAEES